MSRRTVFLLLFSVLTIAAFLRLYRLTTLPPGLYPDEAMDGNNALEATHTAPFAKGLKVFYPEDNGREGLYVNAIAVLIEVSGGLHVPWVVRLPASISGILTVLGIYFLAAEWFGSWVGLLSAFLLATSFWHINFSRIGFRAIMAPLFLVWSLYFLIRGLKRIETCGSSWRANLLSLAGGCLWGLGFYTYIAYRVSPVLLLLVFILYWKNVKKKDQRRHVYLMVCFFLCSAIVAAPLAWYFLSHPGDFGGRAMQLSLGKSSAPLEDLGVNTINTLGMFNLHGDANPRHNLSGKPELFWPVGLLFLLGIALGIRFLGKRWAKPNHQAEYVETGSNATFSFLLLFAWFFLAMLPAVLSDQNVPHALRSILMIPPVIMFAAIGGRALYERLGRYIRPLWLRTAALSICAVFAFEAYGSYFLVWANDAAVPAAFNADDLVIARELNALPPQVPKYVVVEEPGYAARGIPVSAQTVMFVTDTFRSEEQAAKNIHYLLPGEEKNIPAGASVFYIRCCSFQQIVVSPE